MAAGAAVTPTAQESAWPDDAVEVGRIIGAWGVQGWFKVQPHAGQPQALLRAGHWFLRAAGEEHLPRTVSPAAGPPLPPCIEIARARAHGDAVVASARTVADRGAAEALKGARVFVSRASFPPAGPGEYYWVDLIGLQVVDREGRDLGIVEDLLDTGPHCVLRLRRPPADAGGSGEPGERLIPFVEAYIDEVDLPGRRIVADWGVDFD